LFHLAVSDNRPNLPIQYQWLPICCQLLTNPTEVDNY
jgi:hypothetical protein